MHQFQIAYTSVMLLVVIITNYALFSPNWRNLALSDSYESSAKDRIKGNIAMNDTMSNETKLVIPRQMGVLRNRCSYNDDMNDQFADDMTMFAENDMNSIIYNTFEQLNNSDHFCSLWSSEKPISDTIVMVLLIGISLLDFVALITTLIDYDIQYIFKMSFVSFLFQLNLIPTILLTTVVVLYAYCNKQAVDAANHIVRQLASSPISTRSAGDIDVSVGSGFYVGCVALMIHWLLNFGTAIYWQWPRISRLTSIF
ncbi:putative integral membrane protein [Acanthocheilonema viteae]